MTGAERSDEVFRYAGLYPPVMQEGREYIINFWTSLVTLSFLPCLLQGSSASRLPLCLSSHPPRPSCPECSTKSVGREPWPPWRPHIGPGAFESQKSSIIWPRASPSTIRSTFLGHHSLPKFKLAAPSCLATERGYTEAEGYMERQPDRLSFLSSIGFQALWRNWCWFQRAGIWCWKNPKCSGSNQQAWPLWATGRYPKQVGSTRMAEASEMLFLVRNGSFKFLLHVYNGNSGFS